MPTWMSWSLSFLAELVRTLTPKASWPGLVAKAIAVIGVSVTALAAKNRVTISAVSEGGDMVWGEWHIQLGIAICVALSAVLFCWAVGATWVRVMSVQIADELDRHENHYRLAITNTGFREVEVPVWLLEVGGNDGPIKISGLPVLLHGCRPKDNLKIANGIPAYITLFWGGEWRDSTSAPDGASISTTSVDLKTFNLYSFQAANPTRIWLKVAIGDAGRVRWFWVEPNNSGTFKSGSGIPPYIRPTWIVRAITSARNRFS